ncbi:MAG: hypothetical protein HY906_18460 [Deltaproteobacteria bacterium]|nr:hypothetical protein [Deltaproteobacteria bacterium]
MSNPFDQRRDLRHPRFKAWARRMAKRQREPGQPRVFVTVREVQPPRSRLVGPTLDVEAARAEASAPD